MPHAAQRLSPRRTLLPLLLPLAVVSAWLGSGLRRVSDGGPLMIRIWRPSERVERLAPGWRLVPPGLARLVRFPASSFRAPIRAGAGPGASAPALVTREGAGLIAAGVLTLRADPSRAAALAKAFPAGWDDTRSPGLLAERLLPDLARESAAATYADLVAPPPPGRSRVTPAAAGALASMGLQVQEPSRLTYYPHPRPPSGARAAHHPPERRVLLVGLDGADWDIIRPLMDQGRLPTMQRLVGQGARARLKAIAPILSPILWTSIATGVGPSRHGIVDFLAVNKETGEQVPVTSNMRRVKALWNILSERGYASGVVGWWATWPAEPVYGFIVSDRVAYQLFGFKERGGGLLRRTWPEALGLVIQPLIVAPEQVWAGEVERFLPTSAANEPDYQEQTRSLRTILASSRTYAAIGIDLLQAYDPDLKAVYFEGTDTIAHSFMRYRRPRMPGVEDRDVEAFGDVVDRYYEHADALLGEVLRLADERTLVVICSDHGFRTGANRPLTDPRIGVGGAADWHRKYGILLMSGPGVRRGAELEDASLLDIAPTILAAMGLPVARDMEGRALVAAFDPPLSPASIDSYETDDPPQDGGPVASEVDSEILAKLTALGYIAQEGTNALNNTGITLMERGRFSEAADSFRQALKADPRFLHGRINLGRALLLMDDMDGAIAQFQEVLRADPNLAEVHNLLGNIHLERGNLQGAEHEFRRALEIAPDGTDVHNSLGILYERMGRDDQALEEYEKVIAVDPDYAEGFNNIGLVHRRRGDPRRAIELFRKAIEADADFPGSYNNMGLAWQDLGDLTEARRSFERGLQVDEDNAVILNNLGTVDLAEGALEAARQRFEAAIDAEPDYASAYNNLGAVLGMLERPEEAFEQYLKAVELDPNYTDARFNLARSLFQQNRRREALEMLDKVLAIDPRYGKALLQLAIVRMEEGRAEEALDPAVRASREMGSSPDPHNLLADIYLRLRRRDDALRALRTSLTLMPDQPRVRQVLERLQAGGG